jgi:hypothetical protein
MTLICNYFFFFSLNKTDHHGPSAANSIFCSWMALGNILGYSSGSTNNWHK